MSDEQTEEATDAPANDRPHRGWLGAAIAAAVLLAVLRVLGAAHVFDGGPFHAWYAQAGLVVVFIGCYSLIERLVRRSYQRD